MQELVDLATRALAAGDAPGALEALLGLWRRTRAPEIADAIDRVGALVTGDTAAIAGKDHDARRRWNEVATADRAEDVSRLCATLLDVAAGPAAARVRLLARRTPDPRVALALARHVRARTFNTSTASRFYQHGLVLIEKVGDVRALAVLPESAEPVNARRHTRADTTLDVYLPGVRATLSKIEVGALAAETSAALAALQPSTTAPAAEAERKPPRDLELLLDAVYADLASDEPRLVLADALQDVGDPRGELIALQIERARRGTERAGRAEAALVKAHGRSWMGELDAVIHAKGWSYRRGFLAACRVSAEVPLRPTRPWATVEELHFREGAGRGHARDFVLGLPSLRILTGIGAEVAGALATAPQPPPLEALSFGTLSFFFGERDYDASLRKLADSSCRLRLRRLALVWWRADREVVRAVLDAPIATGLEQLVVCGRPRDLAPWLDAVGRCGPTLRSVELRSDGHLDDDLTGYRLVAHRDGGRFTTLDVIGPYRDVGPANSVRAAHGAFEAIAPAAAALGLEVRVRSKREAA